jgi:hypothetical protein
MVVDGVTGWLFDPEEASQTYAALDRALSTPEAALNEMRGECPERALRYAPENLIDSLVECLAGKASIVSGRHSQRR